MENLDQNNIDTNFMYSYTHLYMKIKRKILTLSVLCPVSTLFLLFTVAFWIYEWEVHSFHSLNIEISYNRDNTAFVVSIISSIIFFICLFIDIILICSIIYDNFSLKHLKEDYLFSSEKKFDNNNLYEEISEENELNNDYSNCVKCQNIIPLCKLKKIIILEDDNKKNKYWCISCIDKHNEILNQHKN